MAEYDRTTMAQIIEMAGTTLTAQRNTLMAG